MSAFAEVAPCPLFGPSPDVLAVGWLDRTRPYPTGATPAPAFERLAELCKAPWRPVVTAGFHRGELCQFHRQPMTGELFVPGSGCLHVAPAGIVHYVAAHWYRPPDAFLDAVLACPPMRSMAYMKALLANGGRGLRALRHQD